ncbi:MAG: tyrosine--tRNA ligase [Rickettsiales bacterium]
MENTRTNPVRLLRERGCWKQCTDEQGAEEYLSSPGAKVYIGFDCTAPSLHAGSLTQLMALRFMQAAGVTPIVLIGGGTTRIGDPSGKTEARRMLSDEAIAENKRGIERVVKKILRPAPEPIFVDNADWLDKLGYIELLRAVGSHFSVNRMLSFDSVKLRLEREQSLSFLEFNYMVLQAYDFVELYNRYGCRMQMGGSDQWGNIVCGVELHRRMTAGAGEPLYGLTAELLTTADGKKMGKTEKGAVWLDAELCSPYDYWQYWRNAHDGDVRRFLLLFTELSEQDIDAALGEGGARINDAKILLATEATRLCHGPKEAEKAKATAAALFAGGNAPAEGAPEWRVAKEEIETVPVFKALAASGLCAGSGEARRQIKGGGVKMGGMRVEDENALLSLSFADASGRIPLSVGKKRHCFVVTQ